MRVTDAYTLAIKLLREQSKESPNREFKNSKGDKATIADVAAALERVHNWIHPQLDTEDIIKVVRCNKCSNYKHYKKKGIKGTSFYACSLDMERRDPKFFCGHGIEREE